MIYISSLCRKKKQTGPPGIAGLSLAAGILQEITKGANLELTVYEQAVN